MTKVIKSAALLLAMALCSITVPSATLPTLPVDSRIQKGTLGCGVVYYMVSNPSVKGYADIAVVRRDEAPSSPARESIRENFLSRMAISPGPGGYMTDNDGSTVFRYEKVACYRPEVLDSTLLYTFEQMSRSRSEQAVIICGDIEPAELKKKMDIFSMLVPRILVKEAHAPDYVWEPSPAPVVTVNTAPGKKDVEISVSYSSARIPYSLMNTSQFLVSDILADEFRTVLEHRLRRNLRDAGLPGILSFRDLRSSQTGGDEQYSFTFRTSERNMDPAMRTIAATLGEMDAFGIGEREFADARNILRPPYTKRASATPSIQEDVDRCIAHFLYGAPLCPRSEDLILLTRKNVPDSTQTRYLSNFSSALLEQLANLSLEYTVGADSLDRDAALFYYNLSYLYGSIAFSDRDYSWHSRDTLGLERQASRLKIKGERTEPVTGGKLWTFSNGMRVAYKQVPGNGMFSYSLILNGGLSSIGDLEQGEGGYIGSLLSLYDTGGLTASAFRDLIEAYGITMNADVGVYSMNISGEAPSVRLGFLLKALTSMAAERSFNWDDFGDFVKAESLRGVSTADAMEMQMNPDFPFLPVRRPELLDRETAVKADKYFNGRFSRVNDGILILTGDIDESLAKKLLLKYLGGFTTDRGSLPRAAAELRPIVGTRTVEGTGTPGVHVSMDAEYSVTTETYYAADIARAFLRALPPMRRGRFRP